jgi:hypothetical protein
MLHGAGTGAYPPGLLIAEELDARGWSQQDLARIMDRPLAAVNEIIKGKRQLPARRRWTLLRPLEHRPHFGLVLKMIAVSPCLWNIDEDPNLDFMGLAARKSGGYAGAYSPAQIAWLFLARRAIKPVLESSRPNISRADLIALAGELKRHPGIIAGRLQHEEKMSYSYCRDMLVKIRSVVMNHN